MCHEGHTKAILEAARCNITDAEQPAGGIADAL